MLPVWDRPSEPQVKPCTQGKLCHPEVKFHPTTEQKQQLTASGKGKVSQFGLPCCLSTPPSLFPQAFPSTFLPQDLSLRFCTNVDVT